MEQGGKAAQATEERDGRTYEKIDYIMGTCDWFHCDDAPSLSLVWQITLCSTMMRLRHTIYIYTYIFILYLCFYNWII